MPAGDFLRRHNPVLEDRTSNVRIEPYAPLAYSRLVHKLVAYTGKKVSGWIRGSADRVGLDQPEKNLLYSILRQASLPDDRGSEQHQCSSVLLIEPFNFMSRLHSRP